MNGLTGAKECAQKSKELLQHPPGTRFGIFCDLTTLKIRGYLNDDPDSVFGTIVEPDGRIGGNLFCGETTSPLSEDMVVRFVEDALYDCDHINCRAYIEAKFRQKGSL